MKAKKFFAATLLLCIAMTLNACKKEVDPFLKLSSVPNAQISVSTETVKRFFDYYNDTLTPSDEYGELVPFAGDILAYKSTKEGDQSKTYQVLYGLCTADGRIVVDPVFDNAVTHKIVGGQLYELYVGSAEAKYAEKRLLIASDGSWMMELPKNGNVSSISGDGRFVIERTVTVRRNKKNVKIIYYDFYNMANGKKVFTFDKKLTQAANTSFEIGNFSNGLAPVNVTVTTETAGKDKDGKNITIKNEERSAYFINTSGKKVFCEQTFTMVEEFWEGLAVIQNTDGLWGVIKQDGTYLYEPQFKKINRNASAGYFACEGEDCYYINDTNGQTAFNVYSENADINVIGTENIIYKKTFNYSGKTEFFSAVTGKAFVCNTTGQFPDANSGEHGIFTCSYGSVTDVFDCFGNSIAEIVGFGEIKGVYGNIAVIGNADGNKTMVLNIATGEKSDWLDGVFAGPAHDNGKCIVLSSGGKYSTFDIISNEVISQCEYVKVWTLGNNSVLNVCDDGYVTLYGKDMNVLIRYCFETEVPK